MENTYHQLPNHRPCVFCFGGGGGGVVVVGFFFFPFFWCFFWGGGGMVCFWGNLRSGW